MPSPFIPYLARGAPASSMPEDAAAIARYRDLLNARMQPGADQSYLGPREHGAYAESRVREHPLYGPAEQLLAIPGYTTAKFLGLMGGGPRSTPPSVDELAEGYRGVGRGMAANVGDFLSRAVGDNPPAVRPPATPPMTQGMSEEEVAAMVQRSPEPEPMNRMGRAAALDIINNFLGV